jgi:hypothetical protein
LTASDWSVSSPAHVYGDATVAGALHHENSVMIDGLLTTTSESGSGSLQTSRILVANTWVPTPLSCDEAPNARAFVADATAHVDAHAAFSLAADALSDVKQPTDVTLGCGRYVLSSLEANNALNIHVVGPTVLVIQGRMHIAAPTVFDIAEGGSLELIIEGALEVDNPLSLGPSTVEVGGDIRIRAPTKLEGMLIAPTSSLWCDNTLEVVGGMYVGSARIAAPLTIRAGQVIGVEGWPMLAP